MDKEITVRIICIITLIILILAIILNGLTLDCSKCNIDFYGKRPDEINEPQRYSIKLLDIYNNFSTKCLVEFDTNGFRINQ